ncbi:3-phosphoshikimate 1-carboxyvinyltransferase [Haloplasma contractile]|uniref:3-phosphoshikimate 1-carboxyvinyltransferase n=1 Tax=Haloplasma contractile SSD-17B TaxID=1033810 RepID=U2E940_9MOLU|nr:3-phosphoshikimate 1-carboxyvinyltransferase [Haloplasma contractile]ERJ11658.1 3-phosphoshikimate 1-carboxyvinyltransferase protein [Haloplasma contractile SSD-17B]
MVVKKGNGIQLKGELNVPGDKSISHRSIIFGSLANGTTRVRGLLESQDCLNTVNAFQLMGVNIQKEHDKDTYLIEGVGVNGLKEPKKLINCGNSGTTMRLLTGLLASLDFYSVLYGDESLSNRPMKRVIEPLQEMGANIWCRNKQLAPISIKGKVLKGINYSLPVASAQVKSALLLAGLNVEEEIKIIQPKQSRNHTEIMLKKFGVNLVDDVNTISLPGGKKNLHAQNIVIPGDISSASFFIAAALLIPNSEIKIKNVGINDTRSGIIDVINKMGGTIEFDHIRNAEYEKVADLTIKYQNLKSTVIEGDLIPRLIDELPIVALIASQAEGTTIIRNAAELRVKESDRIKTIVQELGKLGADIEELPDGMVISGPCNLKGGVNVSSHGDHRIAMTLRIANLISSEDVVIDDLECIKTSFPEFNQILSSIIQY